MPKWTVIGGVGILTEDWTAEDWQQALDLKQKQDDELRAAGQQPRREEWEDRCQA